jgi:AGCS family alanine or glycine:cation symporter
MMVVFGLAVFAFSTLVGWSFYGEKAVEYLLGLKAVPFYRLAWVLCIPVGASLKLDLVWLVADTLNALMALPNLIGLLILGGLLARLVRGFFSGEPWTPPRS